MSVAAQQRTFVGTNITGQFVLTRTVDASNAAFTLAHRETFQARTAAFGAAQNALQFGADAQSIASNSAEPPFARHRVATPLLDNTNSGLSTQAVTMQSLPISTGTTSTGFPGLTHYDQRNANNGNQFSIEPPSPSIAVGNGYILEGVNNAIQVYTLAGSPVLPRVLSTNELFGVPPAIDRVSGVQGVNPTDMRVFYDHTIDRWFVLQRVLGNDATGAPIDQSQLYMAVSRTNNPAGVYNIYVMDTRDLQNPGCPCFNDFPQIGADQFGFYIASNQYGTQSQVFVSAQILAVSKASLAAGAQTPTAFKFYIPPISGYEFAIQPASTPPGASPFLGSGGLEYFVSSRTISDENLAIWAMYNTGSLNTQSPNPILVRITVPTLSYISPDVAVQRPGPLPYGSTVFGLLSFIDGGQDSRVLSVVYAGAKLYVTFATQVVDEGNRSLVGGAYVVLSPALRAGALAARVEQQGYLMTQNNHVLRPAVSVNAQGRGAIAFTLVGPEYYPSAAFVPIDGSSVGPIQIAAAGTGPQDGFTGYTGGFGAGVARWGDYSGAVTANDGSIWMVTEYIPTAPRTEFANWGTYIARYAP